MLTCRGFMNNINVGYWLPTTPHFTGKNVFLDIKKKKTDFRTDGQDNWRPAIAMS